MNARLWIPLCLALSGCSVPGTPSLNPRIHDALASAAFCEGCPAFGRLPGVVSGERAHDDDHPLLLASEELKEAIGQLAFYPGGPLERSMAPYQEEMRSLTASMAPRYLKLPETMRPFMDVVVRTAREVLIDPRKDGAVNACLAAYLDAMRRVYRDDPLLIMTKGCLETDPDGSYETLVATMEIVSANESLIGERLAARMEGELEPLIQQILREFNPVQLQAEIGAAMQRIERGRRRQEQREEPVRLNDLAAPLARLEAAQDHAEQIWRDSTLYRVCGAGQAASPEVLSAVLQPRFDATRDLIAKRWARLSASGAIARLASQGRLPSLSQDAVRAELEPLRLAVSQASAERANYVRATRTVTIPSGLVAALCSGGSAQRIGRALEEDRKRAQSLRAGPHAQEMALTGFEELVFGLVGPTAMALAGKEELELVSAVDFLIAHEFAHALFDHSPTAVLLTPREQELRADSFAFVVVDRTSMVALFKRIASLGEDEMPTGRPGANAFNASAQHSPAERALGETLPGGQALLMVYEGTAFERSPDHPPLQERMQWIWKWNLEPLVAPVARGGER